MMNLAETTKSYSQPRKTVGDFHKTIAVVDTLFTQEEIQKYYDNAISNADSLSKKTWVREIWEKVSTDDLKPLSIDVISHTSGQVDDIHIGGLISDEYIIIVHLTPDMQPEDASTIEFWTPNVIAESKEIAQNTPFGFSNHREHSKDIVASYWPKPGRMIIFDARIPHVVRALHPTSEKTRVSLVFKASSSTKMSDNDWINNAVI